MRHFLLYFVLIFTSFSIAMAVESGPSNIVGFVKYECQPGENFIGLPMGSDLATPAALMAAYPEISEIKEWIASDQTWVTPTTLSSGHPYLITCSEYITFYSAGDLIDHDGFNLTTTTSTDQNLIMIPLDKTNLDSASELASDIGVCNSVSTWNPDSQSWETATNTPSGWENNITVDIAEVYMINVTSTTTWPSRQSSQNNNKVKSQGDEK